MVTLIIISTIIPFGSLFLLYLRDLMASRGKAAKLSSKVFLWMGAVLTLLGSAVFGAGAAYYFDFDQDFNPDGIFQAGAGLAALGLFMIGTSWKKVSPGKRKRYSGHL